MNLLLEHHRVLSKFHAFRSEQQLRRLQHAQQNDNIQMLNISNCITRGNRTRLSAQLHDSKEEFAQISLKHANAMEILANAMKMQAEASLIAANAAQRQAIAAVQQAANDAARVEVFRQLTQVLSELLPQYTSL